MEIIHEFKQSLKSKPPKKATVNLAVTKLAIDILKILAKGEKYVSQLITGRRR